MLTSNAHNFALLALSCAARSRTTPRRTATKTGSRAQPKPLPFAA
jgi:hypothetical protein